MRSGATEDTKRRVVSVFFKGEKYDSVRLSAIVDRCEAQMFVPFPKQEAASPTVIKQGSGASVRP
jgi:hypothetical protein